MSTHSPSSFSFDAKSQTYVSGLQVNAEHVIRMMQCLTLNHVAHCPFGLQAIWGCVMMFDDTNGDGDGDRFDFGACAIVDWRTCNPNDHVFVVGLSRASYA